MPILRPCCLVHQVLVGLSTALWVSHAALADDDRRLQLTQLLPRYQQECAACHVAYPPGMLPSGSWQHLLNSLPHHYGTDASLDAATVKQLAGWLTENAGTYKPVRELPPEDRITRTGWFIRKHDEIPSSVWLRPAVKSAANCAACHTRANQGDFNEHYVRIPR
ncbi:diheme cytochrome c [Cupriavidus basilensis]|uniref:diheme cytochrome c n=1 Tax=Cupriavidus basilensis TaxID=68895 RepID=UPI0023E85AE2|nr:diheme cytochrome c [Cupriavidus basilensis]MDF3881071.1 diheme cytochrome c [Cupriavidus basilensis]